MSAEENIAKAKAAYAAFGNADIDAASADLDDSIEWVVPGNSTISGTYNGKDEVIGFWIKLAEKGFTTTPEHFLGDDDLVVVLTNITADGRVLRRGRRAEVPRRQGGPLPERRRHRHAGADLGQQVGRCPRQVTRPR